MPKSVTNEKMYRALIARVFHFSSQRLYEGARGSVVVKGAMLQTGRARIASR
jgi:hypothetical protein